MLAVELVHLPLCGKCDISVYNVVAEIPLLSAAIPADEGIAFLFGILRLDYEPAFFDLLGSNL